MYNRLTQTFSITAIICFITCIQLFSFPNQPESNAIDLQRRVNSSPRNPLTLYDISSPTDSGEHAHLSRMVQIETATFIASQHSLYLSAGLNNSWTRVWHDIPGPILLSRIANSVVAFDGTALSRFDDHSTVGIKQPWRFPATSGRIAALSGVGDLLYAASSNGIYQKAANNPTQSDFDTLISFTTPVTGQINVIYPRNGMLLLGTSNGLYNCSSGDHSCKDFTYDIPEPDIRVLYVVGDTLYAGTRSGGLFSYDLRSDLHIWNKLGSGLTGDIDALWIDPVSPDIMVVGSAAGYRNGAVFWKGGLFWSNDGGHIFHTAMVSTDNRRSPQSIFAISRITDGFIVSSDDGIFYAHDLIRRYSVFAKVLHSLFLFHQEHHTAWWYSILTKAMSLAGIYSFGLLLLLLRVWRRGSAILSQKKWVKYAAFPITKTPWLAKKILFAGYEARLLNHIGVKRATANYYGLPASGSDGKLIAVSSDGISLHEYIATSLNSGLPALIVGTGGGGKSTLLNYLTYLCAVHAAPKEINGLRPILVTGSALDAGPLEAIRTALNKDGVALDGDSMQSLLESGGFLIMFDGLRKTDDNVKALNEVLQFAREPDYSRNRFLIAIRPMKLEPSDAVVIVLKPLAMADVSLVLANAHLTANRYDAVERQLEKFRAQNSPIEPLLLYMIIRASMEVELSKTRSGVYERYFKFRLDVETDEAHWGAWQYVLEQCANWFHISTGLRGRGLFQEVVHAHLVNEREAKPTVLEFAKAHLGTDGVDKLLGPLENAGILEYERIIRFWHSSFEEYFSASYIVTYFKQNQKLPSLECWTGAKAVQFEPVFEFVADLATSTERSVLSELDMPAEWKSRLRDQGSSNPNTMNP